MNAQIKSESGGGEGVGFAIPVDIEVLDGGLVQEVEEDSPAEEAGLRGGGAEIEFQATPLSTGGDVIVAVNGRRLTRTQDLADVISSMSAGERVRLDVLRDGRRRTIEVELGQRPAESG